MSWAPRESEAEGGALVGVRVLDLSRVLAGPWATQLLADLGADVLKVERPGTGDDTRAWGPPWFEDEDGARVAAYFTCANRGKRSITLDLATAEGAERVRALARDCDVLVENFKTGDLDRFGLGFDQLSALNPGLIYCSVTGFGREGPYAAQPGYDFVIQAMGGLMGVTGEAGGPPMKAGVALVNILSGLYACNGVLAALHRRKQTGRGGRVEVALFDVQVAALANQAANYLATGREPQRHGNAHPNIVPYQPFACADGELALAVGNDRQFVALCGVLERPDLAADADYATNAGRVAYRLRLVDALSRSFAARSRGEWLARLAQAGVPAGPVNSVAEVFADPQLEAAGLRIAMPHGAHGEVAGVACPLRLDGVRQRAALGPPTLGEHDAMTEPAG